MNPRWPVPPSRALDWQPGELRWAWVTHQNAPVWSHICRSPEEFFRALSQEPSVKEYDRLDLRSELAH